LSRCLARSARNARGAPRRSPPAALLSRHEGVAPAVR
jgi:hypothetical protein